MSVDRQLSEICSACGHDYGRHSNEDRGPCSFGSSLPKGKKGSVALCPCGHFVPKTSDPAAPDFRALARKLATRLNDCENEVHDSKEHAGFFRDCVEGSDECLVTLCSFCHEIETNFRSNSEAALLKCLHKRGWMAADVEELTDAMNRIPKKYIPSVEAAAIVFWLRDQPEEFFASYFKAIANKETEG